MKLTIRQQLLALGFSEDDFDYLGPNLLVKVNSISWQWFMNFNDKDRIISFAYLNEKWFEIIDGCLEEFSLSQKPFSSVVFNRKLLNKEILSEFKGEDFFAMYCILHRIFNTSDFRYEKNTVCAAFTLNEDYKHHNTRYIEFSNAKLKAITFNNKKEVIAIYKNAITSKEEYYTVEITI